MINRAQLRRPRQRRVRVLADSDGQQLVDLSFELRRRRYGASHGGGLLHRLPGLEGTYAALSTAPQLFTAAPRRDPRARGRGPRPRAHRCLPCLDGEAGGPQEDGALLAHGTGSTSPYQGDRYFKYGVLDRACGPARAPVSWAAMSCAATGGLTRMTSITSQTHATLDGVIDAPPADALLPYMSDAGRQGALDLALAADALLLARETWQGLARAWRDQTGAMAERLNAMPKYVVSATLGSADEWEHTTIVGYDEIAGLREREQLLTYGCGRLARDLLADGLLDVLVLSVTPVVAGAGRRLFDDPGHLVRLRLTDSTTFETGAVRLFLKPDQA